MSAAEEEEDEAFFRNLEESLQTQAQVLKTEFNHLIICWEGNMAGYNYYKRFLQLFKGNLGMEVVNKLTREDALLDLLLKHREELDEDVKAGGSLVYRVYKTVELKIVKEESKANIRIQPQNSEKQGFTCLGKAYKHIICACTNWIRKQKFSENGSYKRA